MAPTPSPNVAHGAKKASNYEVVISGMSGRFPAADSVEEYEYKLFNKIDMVTEDDSRWEMGLFNLPRRNGKIRSIDKFDADFFEIPPATVDYIDPQERIFLETTYEAIVDAGINPKDLKGSKTGLFWGSCFLETHGDFDDPIKIPALNRSQITRVTTYYELRGPLIHSDTACNSSLNAINEAFNSIRSGLCDRAIVVGSNTCFRPLVSLRFKDLKMITKDGTCKCLDESADGYCRSEAIAAVILERGDLAVRTYARILNSKSGSDGYKEEGITFPSETCQRQLASDTYKEVNIDPSQIGYVEAHVTGTAAGDPVECKWIYDLIACNKKDPLLVGCVKSSVGHAEGASGLCSLTKALLVFQHRLIPPNIHYKNPNPKIEGLMNQKLKAVTEITPLPGDLIPVNSFGFGGANTHTLLKGCFAERDFSKSFSLSLPRLIPVCGRMTRSVVHIMDKISTFDRKYMTPDFLHLLNTFTQQSVKDFPFRGYLIASGTLGNFTFHHQSPTKVNTKQRITITFQETAIPLEPEIKSINFVQESLNLLSTLPSSIASLLTLANLIKAMKVSNVTFTGAGNGAIAAAVSSGLLTLGQAYQCIGLKKDSLESLSRSIYDKFNCSKESATKLATDILRNSHPIVADAFIFDVTSSGLQIRGPPRGSFIFCLGELYRRGASLDVTPLYPAVKKPMPSSTPTLSSLILWNHEKSYSIKPYLIQDTFFQKSKNVRFYVDKRTNQDDAFFFDHKIDERVLFPATGYLMLAWNTFAKFSNCSPWDIPIEFRDVVFSRATVLNKTSEAGFVVRCNEDNGDFVVTESDQVIVTGNMRRATALPKIEQEPIDSSIKLDSKQIYREFRVRGYDYGPYFQGLEDCTADGREGTLIWRDVLPRTLKEAMNVETDDEFCNQWMRSWVTFVDAMFQLDIMREDNDSRSLFVPTRLEQLICFPEMMKENLADSPKIMDTLTMNEAFLVNTNRSFGNIVYTKGLSVKGLKTTLLKRRPQPVTQFKFEFTPFEGSEIISGSEKRVISNYVSACQDALSGLGSKDSFGFDLADSKCSLLKNLLTKSSDSLENDYLLGTRDRDFNYRNGFLHHLIDTVVLAQPIQDDDYPFDLLEINPSNYIVGRKILDLWSEVLLFNSIKLNYSLMHRDSSQLDASKLNNIQLIESPLMALNSVKSQTVIILKADDTSFVPLMKSAYSTLQDEGFLIVIAHDLPQCPQASSIFKKMGMEKDMIQMNHIISTAMDMGYILVRTIQLSKQLTLNGIILKKRARDMSIFQHRVIEIGMNDQNNWFEQLKLWLREENEENDKRVWLVPRMNEVGRNNERTQGITGLVKSLRLEEGGTRLRSLIDFSVDKVDINNPRYQQIIKRDYPLNTFNMETGEWGFEQNICLPTTKDDTQMTISQYSYLRSLKPGDFSSLTWVESNLKMKDDNDNPSYPGKLVDVHYSALNFRDIMFASGQLDSEAIPGIKPIVAQDSILGLEFSGIETYSRKRVMGITPYRAIATHVLIEEEEVDFVWPAPDSWSLEEAATVPVVYATAYYALIIRGSLIANESVLIHSGCGGVGLASINICLAMNCKVFTTCGSPAKRQYLKDKFPALTDAHIFNSRDDTFEMDVMKATNGRGVDAVLNSLSEEKLQASMRCLAPNGRFLEIGKVDFVRDHPMYIHQMDDNRSFHGVLLDALFNYSKDVTLTRKMLAEKRELKNLVSNGIVTGVVKPLDTTVFDRTSVEDAFRFMAGGKHIGKVLIQVQEETNQIPMSIPSLKSTYCNPFKSYIVLGGLGGFGMELVQWLANKGAQNLVISSRRGIKESHQMYCMNRLKKRGHNILISTADVTKESGCEELLKQAMQMGPVGGIFNTAVVYKDSLYQDQTVAQFKEVCGPKAEASRHLDKLSRVMCPQLEYFVTFSSISANRGNAGQTNYNFANSFMDSICVERKRAGFPGLSLQWGVVGDVGIVADTSNSNDKILLGSRAQRMHSCFDMIDRFLQGEHSVCLSYIKADPEDKATSDSESVDILSVITRLLGLKDMSQMDSDITLGSLGVDSLIAVEIKQALDKTMGSQISIKEVRNLSISNLMQMSSVKPVVEAAPTEEAK